LAISAHVTWPRAQPPDGSISLEFSLENRQEPSLGIGVMSVEKPCANSLISCELLDLTWQ